MPFRSHNKIEDLRLMELAYSAIAFSDAHRISLNIQTIIVSNVESAFRNDFYVLPAVST